MAVYVGQADNIRQRLQKYGQAGSHLEGSRYGLKLISSELFFSLIVSSLMNKAESAWRNFPQSIVSCRSLKLYEGDDDLVSGGSSSSCRSLIAAESRIRKSNNGPRLFSEVFALGSSIAFRWAHVRFFNCVRVVIFFLFFLP